MNFDFINELRLALESSDVFKWKFLMAGCKAMALALLLFKVIEVFVSSTLHTDEQAPRVASLFNIFAYAFLIMSSDWIIGSIENIFSFVEKAMFNTPSDLYLKLGEAIDAQKEQYYEDIGVMGWITMPIDVVCQIFFTLILGVLISFMKIADMAITVGYLLSRLFLIQLMKLFFPFVIALSTLDITKDLFGKWIKRYIGLFLLGLAYIGIINFCYLIQSTLLNQFVTDAVGDNMGMGTYVYGACITVVVVFSFKVKMFSTATSYVTNFFA